MNIDLNKEYLDVITDSLAQSRDNVRGGKNNPAYKAKIGVSKEYKIC